jgi:hypothetical protein
MTRKNPTQPGALTQADKATAAVLAAMPPVSEEPRPAGTSINPLGFALLRPDGESVDPHPPSAEEVAKRCIVLAAVIAASRGVSAPKLKQWLQHEGIWGAVSPAEAGVLNRVGPAKRVEDVTFECEALITLLWALRKIDRPSYKAGRRITIEISALPPLLTPTAHYIATAQLRDGDCLLEAAQLIWQLNWMARDASLNGRPVPAGCEHELLDARQHAMTWLVNANGEEWDEITIDT